jgi:hypothetical protein
MNLDETESKLNEFSDAFYLSMVEKVIIGKKDDGRKANPYHITFVFKKPFDNNMEISNMEVVSDNESISSLVNNATFSQHALNANSQTNKPSNKESILENFILLPVARI